MGFWTRRKTPRPGSVANATAKANARARENATANANANRRVKNASNTIREEAANKQMIVDALEAKQEAIERNSGNTMSHIKEIKEESKTIANELLDDTPADEKDELVENLVEFALVGPMEKVITEIENKTINVATMNPYVKRLFKIAIDDIITDMENRGHGTGPWISFRSKLRDTDAMLGGTRYGAQSGGNEGLRVVVWVISIILNIFGSWVRLPRLFPKRRAAPVRTPRKVPQPIINPIHTAAAPHRRESKWTTDRKAEREQERIEAIKTAKRTPILPDKSREIYNDQNKLRKYTISERDFFYLEDPERFTKGPRYIFHNGEARHIKKQAFTDELEVP